MFSLKALGQRNHEYLSRLSEKVTQFDAVPSRTADALIKKWAQFGVAGEIASNASRLIMESSSRCYWCGKSLGQKNSSSFDFLLSPKFGGTCHLMNVIVVCGTCLGSRHPLKASDPVAYSRYRNLSAAKVADIEARVATLSTASAAVKPVVHHQTVPGEIGALFLVESKATYVEALQHFKLTAAQGEVELVKVGPADTCMYGLITSSRALAARMLEELPWGCRLVHWPRP